jgi:hypothetical protein
MFEVGFGFLPTRRLMVSSHHVEAGLVFEQRRPSRVELGRLLRPIEGGKQRGNDVLSLPCQVVQTNKVELVGDQEERCIFGRQARGFGERYFAAFQSRARIFAAISEASSQRDLGGSDQTVGKCQLGLSDQGLLAGIQNLLIGLLQ